MKYYCSLLLFSAAVLFLLGGASAVRADDYTTMQSFFSAHPGQEQKLESFTRTVNEPPRPYTGSQNTPVTVAIVYPGYQKSDYWRRSVTAFQARMDKLQIPNRLLVRFTQPHEGRQQVTKINELLQEDPDYLVVSIDQPLVRKTIERLLLRGKPKIIIQNLTTPPAVWGQHHPMMYVGFDHITGSALLADYYGRHLDGRGTYGVIFGTHGVVSQLRGKGFFDQLRNYPDFTRIDSFYTDLAHDRIQEAARQLLSHSPDLSFIYAVSTDICLGVLEVRRQLGNKRKILTNGWGGGEQELAAIERGELDVTVMRMNDDNGVAMAEAIKYDLEQKRDTLPQIFSGGFSLVTAETSPERIKQLRQQAFRYSDSPQEQAKTSSRGRK